MSFFIRRKLDLRNFFCIFAKVHRELCLLNFAKSELALSYLFLLYCLAGPRLYIFLFVHVFFFKLKTLALCVPH